MSVSGVPTVPFIPIAVVQPEPSKSSRPWSATDPNDISNDIADFEMMIQNLESTRLKSSSFPRSDTPVPNSDRIPKIGAFAPQSYLLKCSYNSVFEKGMAYIAQCKTNVGSLSGFELWKEGYTLQQRQEQHVFRDMPISQEVKEFFDRNILALELELQRLSSKYVRPQTEESLRKDHSLIQKRIENFYPFTMLCKQIEQTGYYDVTFLDLNGDSFCDPFDNIKSHNQRLEETDLIANFYYGYFDWILTPHRDFFTESLKTLIEIKNKLSAQKV